ncbi:MAG: hypothetical protein EHM48_09375 [Planctomycetaceae bacterium]|nr:MAG: hypothetical protein EHM48_09375 [Planctomycetaceae bacterium]
MKKLLVVLLVAMVAMVGCKKSESGGGAGNETFKVVVPAIGVNVKQGESQTAKMSIERGDGFKQAVKLEVKAPKGVKVELNNSTVKPGDNNEVQLTITADNDAPIGEGKILVKGTPDKGEFAETEFKVTVSAK